MILEMKKITAFVASGSLFLTSAISVFAQNRTIKIDTTNLPGYHSISTFITAAITLIFIIALIAVLVMLVWGALQWIFSGGEKDAVASARNRILHALIGLAVLAIAIALVALASNFVGIDILSPNGFSIPNPSSASPVLPVPNPSGPPL